MVRTKHTKHPNDTERFDMVCLKASESDLEYDVWLYSSGFEHNGTLMIKAEVDCELIPVVLSSKHGIRPLKPFEFSSQMVLWAKNNYETLLNHWYGAKAVDDPSGYAKVIIATFALHDDTTDVDDLFLLSRTLWKKPNILSVISATEFDVFSIIGRKTGKPTGFSP